MDSPAFGTAQKQNQTLTGGGIAHLVLQSGSTMTQANMSVYINGNPANIISTQAMAGGTWNTTAGNGTFTFNQQNLTTLKHLRFYTRPLTAGEISNNASSSCFTIPDQSAQVANYNNSIREWYRFNIHIYHKRHVLHFFFQNKLL